MGGLASAPTWAWYVGLALLGLGVGALVGTLAGHEALLLEGALAGLILAALLDKVVGAVSFTRRTFERPGSVPGLIVGACWGALGMAVDSASGPWMVAFGSGVFGVIGAWLGGVIGRWAARGYRVGVVLGALALIPVGLQKTEMPLDTPVGVGLVVMQMLVLGAALGGLAQHGAVLVGLLPTPALPPERAWAIALAAPLAWLNDDALDELESLATDEEAAALLSEGWGVTDRASAEKTLTWLRDEGHRASGGPQVLAWDLGRLVQVVRWCVAAEYLDAAVAWRWIEPTVTPVRETYDSWQAFGDGWVAGHEHWKGEPSDDVREATRWLLEDPTSPWCTLAWEVQA